MKKLAIVIPTFNRSDKMEMVLESEIEFLANYNNIDLIVMDSSDNDNTANICYNFNQKDIIKYIKTDEKIGSNEKVFIAYRDFHTNYEYLWIIHDHTVFTEEAFRFIIENLKTNNGIQYYFLKMQSNMYTYRDVNNKEELMYETAWLSGRFGTVILKSDVFLSEVDWNYYFDKYLKEATRNYSHIGFYFERMTELECFKARILEFPRDVFNDISIYEKIGWYGETIRICTECWCSVLNNLSQYYTNTEDVIKTQDSWFLSKFRMIEYKRNRVYSIRDYFKYKKWLKIISPNKMCCFFLIALLPVWLSTSIFAGKIICKIKKAKKCGYKICIFGAGRHGIECMSFLEEINLLPDVFLVSSKSGNPSFVNNYPVVEAKEYIKENKILLIYGVMNESVDEVNRLLNKINKKNIIYRINFE